MRKFDIGHRVYCKDSGVVGEVIKFYTPTSCEEQTLVLTRDRRKYHAPTSDWEPYQYGVKSSAIYLDESPTLAQAYEKEMVAAYKEFYNPIINRR